MKKYVIASIILFLLITTFVAWGISSMVDSYVDCRKQSNVSLDVCLLE